MEAVKAIPGQGSHVPITLLGSSAFSAQLAAGDKAAAINNAVTVQTITEPDRAIVRLHADGSANVLVSTVEMGQGARTVMAQIAAEVLALVARQALATTSLGGSSSPVNSPRKAGTFGSARVPFVRTTGVDSGTGAAIALASGP